MVCVCVCVCVFVSAFVYVCVCVCSCMRVENIRVITKKINEELQRYIVHVFDAILIYSCMVGKETIII